MSAVTWGALSFFLAMLLAGSAAAAVVGLGAWRSLRALRRGSLAALRQLSERLEVLERRAEGLGARADELQRSVRRLSVSVARARVLLEAIQDVRGAVGAVRAFVPRK